MIDIEQLSNKLWLENNHPHIMVHNTFDYACKLGMKEAIKTALPQILKIVADKAKVIEGQNVKFGEVFGEDSYKPLETRTSAKVNKISIITLEQEILKELL